MCQTFEPVNCHEYTYNIHCAFIISDIAPNENDNTIDGYVCLVLYKDIIASRLAKGLNTAFYSIWQDHSTTLSLCRNPVNSIGI